MAIMSNESTGKLNGAATEFKNKTHGAEGQIEKYATQAVEKVEAVTEGIGTKAGMSLRNSRNYLKENPLKGAAMIAAAGAFAGSLITMMMRRRK